MKAQAIDVDTKAFSETLKAYIAKSSKTVEEAINWKAGDLMFQAARFTPKSKLREGYHKSMSKRPRLVSYRTGKRFGGEDLKGWKRPEWSLVRDAMASRALGKGFMRSAFVKAGLKIPRTKRSKRPAEIESARLSKSRADVHQIAGKIKGIAADLMWQASSVKDAGQKQAIVEKSMRLALPQVTKSMQAYLRGEHIKAGKEASAK